MPEDVLLSHGETPHYHRRCIISLLSSGWDQVVLMLYGPQTKLVSSNLWLKDQEFGAWQCPTLTWGGPTLPSAISHFTAEFGMGSGGSNFLWSPGLSGLSYGLCVMRYEHTSLNSGIQSLSFLAAHSCVWPGLLITQNS